MACSGIFSDYPFPVIAGYLATHGPITVTINKKLLQVGEVGDREKRLMEEPARLSSSIPDPAGLPEGCDQGHTHYL